MKYLAKFLKVYTIVQELYLNYYHISSNPDYMRYLAETLKVNTNIKIIYYISNLIVILNK